MSDQRDEMTPADRTQTDIEIAVSEATMIHLSLDTGAFGFATFVLGAVVGFLVRRYASS